MQSDTGTTSITPNQNPNEWGPFDEAFLVRKQRWGTHVSYSLTDNQELITSLTLENCVAATRFYLKGKQEVWEGQPEAKSYDGVVGGKL